MLPASGNGCICSSCFTRSYELYDSRALVGRRRNSLKLPGQPTQEQIGRAQQLWRKYLALRAKRRAKAQVKLLWRQKKVLKRNTEETDIIEGIRCSEVFLESPTSVDGRVPIRNLNVGNFWDFVYQRQWKGRIRVCEGELMYKITETFKKLVSIKVIADFNVTRMFATESREKEFEGGDIPMHKVRIQSRKQDQAREYVNDC